MTKQEAAQLVGIVIRAYPSSDRYGSREAVVETVNLWAVMFEEDDSSLVGLAVKKHIATNKWPPSVAEIREIMLEMTAPELIPPDEAWRAVSEMFDTVSEYAGNEEYAKRLPPLVNRAAEAVGWKHLRSLHRDAYIGQKAGLDRLAYLQQYTPLYEREKRRAMTPGSINAQIGDKRAERIAAATQLSCCDYTVTVPDFLSLPDTADVAELIERGKALIARDVI